MWRLHRFLLTVCLGHLRLTRPAVLLVLLTIATFHHAQLGLQVVLEDYVHTEWLKITAVALVKFAAIALAVATIFSIVRIALG